MTMHVHILGIGGTFMGGVAAIAKAGGFRVTGSDLNVYPPMSTQLQELGIEFIQGYGAEQLDLQPDIVVVGNALSRGSPVVEAMLDRGMAYTSGPQWLAEQVLRKKHVIAVAGTHGKTTTTSLVATILRASGFDPTVVVGGRMASLSSNARLGAGDLLVAEADESDGSFLRLSPAIAVITNVDPEHLDYYGTVEALHQAFVDFADRVPFYGLAVLCVDHPVVQHLIPRIGKRHTTYGVSPQAEWRADDVKLGPFQSRFTVSHKGNVLGEVTLRMVGAHNVLNALACCAVAQELGIPFKVTVEALREFAGVQRRFTVRGEVNGITVVDDYGHHPAEIRATLAGARASFPHRRIVCAFQPHRYTRTRDLFGEFATAFNDADAVLLTDIYAAGEDPIAGVSGARLHDAVKACGHRDAAFVERPDLARKLREKARQGDLVLTLGAGDITHASEELLELLK